jgi:ligand-binding sensor domain-containing protein
MLSARLYAQQHGLKLYNVNNGLPSSFAYRTCQDKVGYIWVATTAGLSRFDGRQFVNYTLSDGLLSLKVDGIFQDSKDRLWFGTNAGMVQFKNNRFITYPTNDNLNISGVPNFIETKNNRLWACTSKGVYEFADSIWNKVSLYPGFKNLACEDIIETNGELYCNYRYDIVCKNKDGKWLHIASQHDYDALFNFISFQNNQVWVSTNKNIYIIQDHRLVPLYKKNIANYFTFFVDSKKRLWLGEKDSLKISRPGDWQHFSDSIYDYGFHYLINEDSNHNIWIGKPDGLLKIKDITFTIIDKNKAVPLDGIYNIIALPDNRLLFSSGTKTGLQLYTNNSCKQIMPPTSPGNENYYWDPVDAYTFDDRNTLWMVTVRRKFLHFNGKTLEDFSDVLHFKTTVDIYDIDFVKSRKQFFICGDSTLLYGSCSKLSPFIPHNTGIPINKPTHIHGLKNGLILLYIEGRGVYGIDTANNYISLIKETGIDGSKKGNNLDLCFYEATDNTFWIAFPGLGLYEYSFKKTKLPFLKNHITINDGLQSNKIISLTNDRQNRLWIATDAGLDILQKNKAGSWEVFNYAKAEDLAISAPDFEKLVYDTKGNIWLSSPNKIIKFNPENITLNKETPRIIIEKVTVAFKETDWSKLSDSSYSYFQLPFNPVLNYNQNSIGIFFNAIDLSTSNSTPEYSYKLLPLDTSWSISSKIKSVSFAQLPPGKYQFMVRAKDNASGWSQPALFSFSITPPFWGKWWFRLLVIAIASLIIVRIFRSRIIKIKNDSLIRNQLKELEMKALKAQMNPHFIYNALNSIQALFADDKKMEGIHYIGSFSRLLRQVLDNSENNVISLDKELETIGFYIQLEALRLDMQLQYKKIIPENIVAEFEKIPPLILQPFVENALWHGLSNKEGEKEIKIRVSTMNEWLVCEITDNGIGRVKAAELKSNSGLLHQSKAIDITRKRLIDFNEDDLFSPIEFFDLYDDKKNSIGTSVTVRIKRKFSSASNSFNKSNT